MSSLLSWVGDNIGVSGDAPASIDLMLPDLTARSVSVRQALAMDGRITAYGRSRIISGLRICAEEGSLHPDDLAAYRAWEKSHG